jgi:hypothetical protein
MAESTVSSYVAHPGLLFSWGPWYGTGDIWVPSGQTRKVTINFENQSSSQDNVRIEVDYFDGAQRVRKTYLMSGSEGDLSISLEVGAGTSHVHFRMLSEFGFQHVTAGSTEGIIPIFAPPDHPEYPEGPNGIPYLWGQLVEGASSVMSAVRKRSRSSSPPTCRMTMSPRGPGWITGSGRRARTRG